MNNAGISTFGEVEFTSMETYKEVAEVNLWGTVRTTKSFLPLIRRAKGELERDFTSMHRIKCHNSRWPQPASNTWDMMRGLSRRARGQADGGKGCVISRKLGR